MTRGTRFGRERDGNEPGHGAQPKDPPWTPDKRKRHKKEGQRDHDGDPDLARLRHAAPSAAAARLFGKLVEHGATLRGRIGERNRVEIRRKTAASDAGWYAFEKVQGGSDDRDRLRPAIERTGSKAGEKTALRIRGRIRGAPVCGSMWP